MLEEGTRRYVRHLLLHYHQVGLWRAGLQVKALYSLQHMHASAHAQQDVLMHQ